MSVNIFGLLSFIASLDFQITYAQKSWSEERLAWKSIILLNLVRSVNIMTRIMEFHSDMSSQSSNKNNSSERLRSVLLRLTPLRQIEKDLKVVVGAGSSELSPESTTESESDETQSKGHEDLDKAIVKEFGLRSSSGWKSILAQLQSPQLGKGKDLHRVACHVVRGCKEDIQWLWGDSVTKRILHERGVRLEDLPGL